MLAQDYKFHFVNNSGVQLDFNGNSANEKIDLDLLAWKLDSNGAKVDGSEVNLAYSAADIADGGSAEFTGQDNSTNLQLGLHGRFTVQTDNASAAGPVDLYLEYTTDGGTTFPSDAANFDPEQDLILVASVTLGGAQTRAVNFEL